MQTAPPRNNNPQGPPSMEDEEPELQEDEVVMMIQNLWEKKALGVMSKLDKQLLTQLQTLIGKNPKNYSSKVGYL